MKRTFSYEIVRFLFYISIRCSDTKIDSLYSYSNNRNHMEEFAKHEIDLIRKYEDQGFTHDFRHDSGKLIDTKSKNAYSPRDIKAIEQHRYEGMSNPSDLSILYALEMEDGIKGTFLMAYGPSADFDTAEFFKAIPKEKFDME